MKVYCDTSSLLHNALRHADYDLDRAKELNALKDTFEKCESGKLTMLRSNVVLREVERTPDPQQAKNLLDDVLKITPVAADEKLLGFDALVTDPYGGFVSNPLVSDVQDEKMASELVKLGLKRADAQHITQAICNGCDVFLTLDCRSVLRKKHKIERQFPIKVYTPSELLTQI